MISFRSAAVLSMVATVVVPGHGSALLSMIGSPTTSLPAVVTPILIADVGSQVDGDVIEVFVREGETAQAAQPLVRIDDRIPAAQAGVAEAVAQSRAEIELAESELRQAQRVRSRMQAARSLDAVADAEVERAVTGVELAEARLRQAHEQSVRNQQQLKLEQARVSVHLIRAPFAGEVMRIEQSIGNSVRQGETVIRVADLSRLQAAVFMPYSWFDRVRAGQQIQVQASTPLNRLIPAQIVSVEPAIDAATETFRCVVEIDNSDRSLPSGFTVVVMEQHLAANASSSQDDSSQDGLNTVQR